MIEMADTTPDGFVRVWTLDRAGQPYGGADPLPATDPDAAAAAGRNAAVRALLAGVETYRARLLTPTPNRNRRLQVIDIEQGYIDGGPDPEWVAYDQMQVDLANTPEDVIELAHLQDYAAGEVMMDFDPDAVLDGLLADIAAAPENEAALPVPEEATNYQVREALRIMGLFAPINAAIMALDIEHPIRNAWEYGNVFQRTGPVMGAAAAAFSIPEVYMDRAARLAVTIL